MEVILKNEIENLGSKDEIVNVKPGYARNYLIPRGLAIAATKSAKKMHTETMRQRAHKLGKVLEEAKAFAEKLASVTLKIGAKAGENGKIFGSVNSIQVSEALTKAGFTIDRKQITLAEDTIKELGEYEAKIRLHKEVTQAVQFEVVGE